MLRYLSLFLLALLPLVSTAQESIIYFDKDWRYTPRKKNAAFYRPLPKKEGEFYKLVDYYINGKVQMTGYYAINDPLKLMQESLERAEKQGIFKYYYPDGTLKAQEEYLNDKPHGKWASYNEKGQQLDKTEWNNGEKAGDWTLYYEGTTQPWYSTSYILGKQNGASKSYYPDGKLKRDAIYENDMLLSGKMYDTKGKEIPFTPFEQMPSAPYDLDSYMVATLVYPNKARSRNAEGRVRVQFYVDRTGKISNAFILRSVHPSLDKEALPAVQNMPAWNPGKQD